MFFFFIFIFDAVYRTWLCHTVNPEETLPRVVFFDLRHKYAARDHINYVNADLIIQGH